VFEQILTQEKDIAVQKMLPIVVMALNRHTFWDPARFAIPGARTPEP
jgi:hypothetical protein